MGMALLSPEPDGVYDTQDIGETEDDSVELDDMPINVTTINVPADASGKLRVLCSLGTSCCPVTKVNCNMQRTLSL